MEIEKFVDLENFLKDLIPFNSHKGLSPINEEYLRLLLRGFDARHIAIHKFRSNFYYQIKSSYPDCLSEEIENHINHKIDAKANEIRTAIARQIKPVVERLVNSKVPGLEFHNRSIWHEVFIFLLTYYPTNNHKLNFEITFRGNFDQSNLPRFLKIVNENADNYLTVEDIEQGKGTHE